MRVDLMQQVQADHLLGKFLTKDHYDTVISSDCDVYKPDGSLLLVFRKARIPLAICSLAYKGLFDAAAPSNNRGMAAGDFDPLLIAPQYRGKPVVQHGNGYKPILADGTLSKTIYYNQVESGIVGYMDRSARFPFCRQTAYTEKNLHKFVNAFPVIRQINELFKQYVPDRYDAQRKVADAAHKDFIITGTCFSTVTVNKNYRTAGHRDAGDLPGGFGNLTVMEAGKYLGGYTVFPKYRVAVDVRMGDMCFMDVHEIHGNTELIGRAGQYVRLSLVCYLREKISDCGSVNDELERAKRLGR